MASDQQVNSQMVLQSLLELQRQGALPAMQHLEKVEPDLASYLMETLALIHQKLLELGAPARKTHKVYWQIETLALVCIVSLRKGHLELWREKEMGPRLQQLESADDQPAPPPPTGSTDSAPPS